MCRSILTGAARLLRGRRPTGPHFRFDYTGITRSFALAAMLCLGSAARAQLPIPPSTQFDITGFIQEASLDPTCAADPHCGGSIKVNGHVITIPKETVVMLPANALTWQELFAQAPAPYTGAATGMALADSPAPLATYEIHVIGNRVLADANHAADAYIAGLVYISQQALNSGAGFINCMDYATGEMRVGGALGDCTSGTRVRINDPVGRYGRVMTPDARFTVDPDNPTISAGTGFPMCFPRSDPVVAIDPLCPEGNRARDVAGNPVASISMPNPGTLLPGQLPDPRIQVPFEVGDYVTFAGTLVTDNAQPTVGPFPGTANTYVAAHTITNNIAVYTFPGTSPAYVLVETTLIGTGGLTVAGAGEAAIRTRFEGMTTDPSRNIHLYGIDVDPASGALSDRDWGTIGVDPGPPVGAVKGRWRFRPPCTATVATDKSCTPPPAGTFLPPTREMRAVIEGLQSQVAALVAGDATKTAANGIFFGQYHAPISEYIFPENIPGTPIVENNFNTLDFLAKGGYTSAAGTLVGVLNPWPSNVLPVAACAPPVVSAGGSYTVASGGSVTLGASATGTAPVSFAWIAPAQGALSSLTVSAPVYSAPVVGVQTAVAVSVTATNACGSGTASTIVTVNAAAAPTVAHVAPITIPSGSSSSFVVSGTDPANLALTFTATQSGTPALNALTVTQLNATSARVDFTAPALPIGQVTPAVVNLTITARNAAGVSSAAEFTTVTITPLADTVTITAGGTEYRTGKLRLTINASSSVISPNVVLTLQPYLTQQGTTFDPASLGATFANNGGGLYTITLVGAPAPMCNPGGPLATPCSAKPLVVRSNLNGASPPAGLDRVRQ